MGLIRIVLAISVVIDHSAPVFGLRLAGGRVAVQMFYMISGFYMALVLHSKYKGPGSYGRFLASRAARLLPSYWAMVALTLLVSVAAHAVFGEWGRLEPWVIHRAKLSYFTQSVLVASNAIIVGQDGLMFTGITPSGDGLRFVTDFHRSVPPVYEFLLVPQAWSLSIEMLFYLVAPLLLRQTTAVLLAGLAGSLGLRIWLFMACGLSHDPWTYRFFPCELALFILGALAFRLTPALGASTTCSRSGFVGILSVVCLVVFYPGLIMVAGAYSELVRWGMYTGFFLLLPAVFVATKDSSFDRAIGEVSYPLYICHVLVASILKALSRRSEMLHDWLGELTLVGSLVLAVTIISVIIKPLDRWRSVYLSGQRERG